jgi:hypothetical protein
MTAHSPFVAAFNEGLQELGFMEGQNLAIEYSWAESNFYDDPKLTLVWASGRSGIGHGSVYRSVVKYGIRSARFSLMA